MKNSFKNLSFPEQKAKRDELVRKYMELRFQMVIGHVDNPLQKRGMRRQLARLNTLIRQHEIAEQRQAILQNLQAVEAK
ncbi:MAG: 50S ribosomal protein L29 [Treponema sp.]|jgi:large subunit ribosomal protein L29|nr:50S ribosomal protein L29 [Treponema sp.]